MMVAAAAAVLILVMVMMVMMLVLVHQLGKLVGQGGLTLHGGGELLAGELRPGGGDDDGLVIVLPKHGNGGVQLGLGNGIRPGQDDGGGGLHLVVVELTEVLHIDLDLARVYHGYGVAQGHFLIHDLLHRADDIGQLAHAGGLDENPVGVVLLDNIGQRLAEIAHQGAADAAGVHLGDLNARILQKAAVNADFAEFVLDQHDFLTLVGLGNQFLDEGSLAGSQEAGVNVNFRHNISPFQMLQATPRKAALPLFSTQYYSAFSGKMFEIGVNFSRAA